MRLVALFFVALLALATAAGTGAAGTAPERSSAVAQLERLVLVELNSVRRTNGLSPLRASAPLSAAAQNHSRAMGRFGFFAHESRDGSPFHERVRQFYGPKNGRWSVGENLLWATAGIAAKKAVELWMQSPGHRENILTPRWREIGLAAVSVAGAPGVFGGRDVVIVTTDFGVR
ncbi:MAG: CAP domain-containing protein [Actinobacteria bacterium]|nr:CAP domain-containing protein [Actinomycetota bacterium]